MRRSLLVALSLVAAAALLVTTTARWWPESEVAPPPSAGAPNAVRTDWPIFHDVTGLVVHRQHADELLRKDVLAGARLDEAIACVLQTRELVEPLDEPPLEDVVLLEVRDGYGERMFELASAHALRGAKGRTYWSPCLSSIAR